MNPKEIGIGIVAVTALAVAVIDPKEEPTEKTVYVSAGKVAADEAMVALAGDEEKPKERNCIKSHINLDGVETTGWVCDGAYYPATQAELNKMAGEKGVQITLTPRETATGYEYDALVKTGEMPAKYEPPVVEDNK